MRVTLNDITDGLVAALSGLTFAAPVVRVYNPLTYARPIWDAYCARYGRGPRESLLLGTNPGPPGSSPPCQGGRP